MDTWLFIVYCKKNVVRRTLEYNLDFILTATEVGSAGRTCAAREREKRKGS